MWTHNRLETMNNNVLLFCRSNRLRTPLPPMNSNTNNKAVSSAGGSSANFNQYQFGTQQQQQSTPATVTWFTPDDKPIKPDETKYEILETGDLLIHDLRWTDMGSYTCTVSDEHSTDSVAVFVYPTKVSIVAITI